MEMLYHHVCREREEAQKRINELEGEVRALRQHSAPPTAVVPASGEVGLRAPAGLLPPVEGAPDLCGGVAQFLPARMNAGPPAVAQQVNGSMGVTINGDNARVLQMDVKVMASAAPQQNLFGAEDVSHINRGSIYDVFMKVAPRALPQSTVDDPAMLKHLCGQLVTRAAMLIYSDPDHPENITCYLPKMTSSHAMTYGEHGWTLQPVSIVVSPMMRASIDLLFDHQPVAGREGCPDKEFSLDRKLAFKRLLEYIEQNEERIAMDADDTLRPVLVGNADLLRRVCQAIGGPQHPLPVSCLVRQNAKKVTALAVREADK
jgi:hypothetical protein